MLGQCFYSSFLSLPLSLSLRGGQTCSCFSAPCTHGDREDKKGGKRNKGWDEKFKDEKSLRLEVCSHNTCLPPLSTAALHWPVQLLWDSRPSAVKHTHTHANTQRTSAINVKLLHWERLGIYIISRLIIT